MATPQVLDFSQTGVLDIQDGSGNSLDVIHLRQVNYVGQVNASFSSDMTNPDNTESVFIGIVGRIGGITLDIRNITSPSYADTQQLIRDIKDNIAAMYAGGGGGGGVTSVNGDTGPAVSLAFSTVGGGGIRMIWSNGANPTGGEFGADSNVSAGAVTELYLSYAASGAPFRVFDSIGSGADMRIVLTSYADNSDTQQTISFRVNGAAVDDALNQWFAVPVSQGDPSVATLGSGGEVWYMTFIPT